MKIPRKFLVAIITLISVCVGAGGYFVYLQHKLDQELAAQIALSKSRAEQMAAQRRAKLLAENTRPLADKAMNVAIPQGYPKSKSDWKSTEKSIYQKLLSNEHSDVLIVPFQVQEYAFDRPTRSLMTAELSQIISETQHIHLPDPYLVARALGEDIRRLDPVDVYDLANKIGAKKIVWCYAGHGRNNRMAITIQVQARDANDGFLGPQTPISTKNLENIPFSEVLAPIDAYQTVLPDILAAVGLDISALSPPKVENSLGTVVLPATPLKMLKEKPKAARDALYFQLLASLTPHAAERTKERFAEKSLLAIFKMSPNLPEYRLLKARAFMMLGLRPAALQVLGDPKLPEEQELAALLNGNQPDVERFGSKIKPGVTRMIAKLDANYLGSSYGYIDKNVSTATAVSLKLPGKIWPMLAVRAFADTDMWALFENVYFKQLLDHEYPIKDFTAESMVRSAAVLGDAEKLQMQMDLSVINHIRKLFETDALKWCCQSTIDHPSDLDYLDLIAAIGNDNLMRHADFLTQIQGRPERTLEYLNRLESVYKGNPEFTLARAQAQIRKASAVEGAEKEGLLKSAYVNLFDVMYWEQGQSYLSADAFNEVGYTEHHDYGPLTDNYYASDYPFRAYYPSWEKGGNSEFIVRNAEAALRNSTSNIAGLVYLDALVSQKDKHDALYKSIEGRFDGNPSIYQLKARNSTKTGDLKSAEKYFRKSIKVQPKVWSGYLSLGTLLIEQGKLRAANTVFMSYPGFRNGSKENPVGISNAAHQAGSKYYWLGEFSLASPLYKLASRNETGSNADIASRLRLKLIEGDYRGALQGMLERARHYNDSYAYRDYLGMLHAIGASKEAWDVFNTLAAQIDDPHIWETALVGHRKDAKTELEVAAWVKQMVTNNIGKRGNRAAIYLLRNGITDRIPSKELWKSLASVELPIFSESGRIVRHTAEGVPSSIVGPRGFRQMKADFSAQSGRIKSDIAYFAEAYQAIRINDFVSAKTILQEASNLYELRENENEYILSYYAFASAKNGDRSDIENYLDEYKEEQKGFDFYLAKAVLAGTGGRTKESMNYLKMALYRRPFTEDRPIQTEYQYAEICEWLYEATGKQKFKEEAIDWAKKNQKFQPWFAWSYAMEAKLADSSISRNRAIAMAFYLDPQSERLSHVPKKEIKAALKQFKGKNPFINLLNSNLRQINKTVEQSNI